MPLLFVGLALWVEEGLPRPRLATSVTLAVGFLLVVALPIARLRYNASFQSPALMPWLGAPVASALLRVMVASFFLVCGLLWLRSTRHATGWLWLLVGVVMTLTFMSTSSGMTDTAASAAKVSQGRPATWVDDSIPGSSVAVVWDERRAQGRTIEPFYQWIMVTEVFNTTVGDVYRRGPATYYEKFLPTKPVSLRADAVVVRKGRPLAAEFALVTCRTPVRGVGDRRSTARGTAARPGRQADAPGEEANVLTLSARVARPRLSPTRSSDALGARRYPEDRRNTTSTRPTP